MGAVDLNTSLFNTCCSLLAVISFSQCPVLVWLKLERWDVEQAAPKGCSTSELTAAQSPPHSAEMERQQAARRFLGEALI